MLVAADGAVIVGCLTYDRQPVSTQIVTLDAFRERIGVGTSLLRAALALGGRVWLVTTNDNVPAQTFYESRHGKLVAIHKGAVAQSRKLKPSIPYFGHNGVAIVDELQYEWSSGTAA